ncbi:MAG: hypothetical protein KTR25_20660 [Myxococcales bacterium]|nr:hypothetical protein [Myxococcales bacterium]
MGNYTEETTALLPHCEARITKLIQPANGSSQPWLCLLDDGEPWLVKFAGSGPGREALLAEHIANSLGQLWKLPVPESKLVRLDSSVPRAGTDEFWDVMAASMGLNLAIRYIPNTINIIPDITLPPSTLELILSFDLLLANWDRTTLSQNLLRDQTGILWWIDHGSCRFLHHLKNRHPFILPSTHFLFECQNIMRPHPLPMLDESSIHALILGAPKLWLEAIDCYDQAGLANDLIEYLQHAISSIITSRPSEK